MTQDVCVVYVRQFSGWKIATDLLLPPAHSAEVVWKHS